MSALDGFQADPIPILRRQDKYGNALRYIIIVTPQMDFKLILVAQKRAVNPAGGTFSILSVLVVKYFWENGVHLATGYGVAAFSPQATQGQLS